MRLTTLLLCLGVYAPAQVPHIDVIDFYGLHKTPEVKVREAVGVKEGDQLPPSKGDVEERLDGITGVAESHLEAVYDAKKMILYVGLEERGAPHFDIREAPEGDMKLPETMTKEYRNFVEAAAAASRNHIVAEDLTQGHARSADPETRKIQDRFPLFATEHLAELRDVLRNSADEDQRAIAAYIIGYAPNKREVINDLQYALKDADAGVRANATRSLIAIEGLAKHDPNAGIKISPTWFIEMLNSLSWSDRNRAVMALLVLTDQPDPSVLDQIRDRALPSLIDMARWKTLAHALPPYLLLGRVAGLAENDVQAAWSRGDREWVISQANAGAGKKKTK
ncbi:MAG TPA: HEAT repeat domain-containing protein [Bryobacteraceae bacterium]|nr:HEAT repeat domain-containing protein [Bryobacteraceae bacterium]